MRFFYNIHLKILAVISAILLWFFVVGVENNTYRFPEAIEINAINISNDLSVASDLDTAKLRVRASQDIIKKLTKSDFEVFVDLKNRKIGEYTLPVIATSKNDKVSVLKIDPSVVYVKLEEIAEKELKIKAAIIGVPQKNYIVKEVILAEEIVKIKGSKSIIDKIINATASVNLNGSQTASFKAIVPLLLNDNKISSSKNIIVEPAQVLVEVIIASEFQQKTIIIKPVLKGATDAGDFSKKITISPLTVIIQGKEDLLQTISYLETEPIAVEALKATEKPIPVKLVIPEGITLFEPQNNKVYVSLSS